MISPRSLIPIFISLCLIQGCVCDDVFPHLEISSSSNAKLTSTKSTRQTFVLIKEGETANLTCLVVFDESGPRWDYDINWYLSGAIMDRLTSIKGSNSYQIIIKDVVPSDSGPIRCTAKAALSGVDEDGDANHQMVEKIIFKVKSKPSGSCGPSFFQCPDSHCIGQRFLCDGVEDCPDGADESLRECGVDPCNSKLRCEDLRCMDPSLCCNPDIDGNCTVVPVCCLALVESNRHFFQLGVEKRNKDDMRFLHSTIYTVVGCVMAFIALIILVTVVVCRLHVRRNHLAVHLGNTCQPPLSMHDLDLYFQSMQCHNRHAGGNARSVDNITYNINNGVQFVTAPPPPPVLPPYHAANEPPPPYEAANGEEEQEEQDELLNEEEENNNGDINGNSDLVNQNIVAQPVLQGAGAAAGRRDNDEGENREESLLLQRLA